MQRKFLNSISEWDSTGVLSILGVTGSGKTSLVLDWVNKNYPQDKKTPLLVSLDSIAAFKGLDIGSAKPSDNELTDYDWVGIDLLDVSKAITAAIYADNVKPQIDLALKNSRPVILVGGSFFYEKYLTQGSSVGSESCPNFILELEAKGAANVLETLITKDHRWSKLNAKDEFRVFRYADLVLRQDFSYDELHAKPSQSLTTDPISTLVLETPEDHWVLLEARVKKMFADGFVDETKNLVDEYGFSAPGLASMGYRQVLKHLDRTLSLEECKEKVYIEHRQLAKKQRTWLRGKVQSKNSNRTK